ncbi:uncharacterized protein LOC133520746 [Cydia pomonella]|uniref:uncharacterized protein LOC133520746 n=1 Tax=Cydia pomonella TaxID=82600 RepID=UPI002ADD8B81|nr:uncharacterized protein LOC133520746 [Cydia pomonella]
MCFFFVRCLKLVEGHCLVSVWSSRIIRASASRYTRAGAAMAPGFRLFCLLLICGTIFVNVETKSYKSSKLTHHSTNKPSKPELHPSTHHSPVHETISKPVRHADVHATQPTNKNTGNQGHGYPSDGLSGSVTSAPPAKRGYNPLPQASPKPLAQQPSYPGGNGLSGSGTTHINKQTAPQSTLYPGGSGLSGDKTTHINKQTAPQSTLYPGGSGLSGDKTTHINKQTAPQSTLYPGGSGLSGDKITHINKQTAPQSTLYPGGSGLSGDKTTHLNKQTAPQATLYPGGSGLSGGGTNNINKQTAPQATLYPGGNGLSGGGTNIINKQTAPQATLYPGGNGLSGGGTNNINKQTAPQATLYPGGSGLSGGQTPPTATKPHTYPNTNGQSGGGFKPGNNNPFPPTTNVVHKPVEPSYNHIYVRNHHTTNIYHNNIHTTNVHHYHYEPPRHVHYVHNDMVQHYPVYREKLPEYVYEYRSSRSRFNVLLTGLALYNLGHVSKSRESLHYHNYYNPSRYEVCKFGVQYNVNSYDEMDIDCRLITDFIRSVKKTNYGQFLLPDGTLVGSQPNQVQPNVIQVLLSDGTLARLIWNPSYDVVVDALDPRFNGEPLHVNEGMKCYMKYYDGYSFPTPQTKYVSCKLLETYVTKSFNSASKIASSLFAILIPIFVAAINL